MDIAFRFDFFSLHSKKVAHRDLKPENWVFEKDSAVDPDASLRLIDFGCAKVGDDDYITDDHPQSMW